MRDLCASLSGERGALTPFLTIIMIPLVAFVALAIDTGTIYVTRSQLQNAVDSAAVAAMAAARDLGQAPSAAAASAMVEANLASLPQVGVRFGEFDFSNREFSAPGLGGAPAVEVVALREDLPLFFARVLGRQTAKVSARAVAVSKRRELVIAQDVTRSFQREIGDAKTAHRELVNEMESQGMAVDRVGLVVFAGDASEILEMTPLDASGATTIRDRIADIEACAAMSGQLPPNGTGSCLGTDHAAGIRAAIDVLDASPATDSERVIVLVSDGDPCRGGSVAGAMAAAELAEERGISIIPVMLNSDAPSEFAFVCPASERDPQSPGPELFNEQLARGLGRPFYTLNSGQLSAFLQSILDELPVQIHLVE